MITCRFVQDTSPEALENRRICFMGGGKSSAPAYAQGPSADYRSRSRGPAAVPDGCFAAGTEGFTADLYGPVLAGR
jgi:hypothetical protein